MKLKEEDICINSDQNKFHNQAMSSQLYGQEKLETYMCVQWAYFSHI